MHNIFSNTVFFSSIQVTFVFDELSGKNSKTERTPNATHLPATSHEYDSPWYHKPLRGPIEAYYHNDELTYRRGISVSAEDNTTSNNSIGRIRKDVLPKFILKNFRLPKHRNEAHSNQVHPRGESEIFRWCTFFKC